MVLDCEYEAITLFSSIFLFVYLDEAAGSSFKQDCRRLRITSLPPLFFLLLLLPLPFRLAAVAFSFLAPF